MIFTKSKLKGLIQKKYVHGKGKMVVVQGGALPLALMRPLAMSAMSSVSPSIINAIKGDGLRPHGMNPMSQALSSLIQNASSNVAGSPYSRLMSPSARLATMSKIVRMSKGQGLVPHGGQIEGGNILKSLKKGFKQVGKFFTSKGTKSAIRMVRQAVVPHLRKALPALMPLLLKATNAIPVVGPALSAVTSNPVVSSLATEGSIRGIDALNNLAQSKGYGVSVKDGVKYTRKQLAQTTKGLDKHSLGLLNNMMVSAPVKGRGLQPL